MLLDGVLGGDHEERVRQDVPHVVHRDLALGHGFQEGTLRARGGAVDLVGQKHVGEDGPRQELEFAGVLVEDAEPGDVARQQVGRALDPRELAAQCLRQGLGQRRLAQARQVLDEQVPARQQAGEHVLDHVRLAAQHAVERGADAVDRAGVCLVQHDRRRSFIVLMSWPPFRLVTGLPGGTGESVQARTADRQVCRMSHPIAGAGSPGPAGAWTAQSARRTSPSRAARGSPAARPATGKYHRASVSPGGRGRPAHRARQLDQLQGPQHATPRVAPRRSGRSRSSPADRARRGGASATTPSTIAAASSPAAWPRAQLAGCRQRPGDPFGPGADRGHQLVAGGRLDGDPAPVRQPDLGPEVDVVAGHRRVAGPRVVTPRRRVQAADDPRRIAQRPQEHGRRGGEQVVRAAPGAQQELGDDVGAAGRGRGRSVVGVALAATPRSPPRPGTIPRAGPRPSACASAATAGSIAYSPWNDR